MNSPGGSRNGIVLGVEEVTRKGVRRAMDELTIVKGFAKLAVNAYWAE